LYRPYNTDGLELLAWANKTPITCSRRTQLKSPLTATLNIQYAFLGKAYKIGITQELLVISILRLLQWHLSLPIGHITGSFAGEYHDIFLSPNDLPNPAVHVHLSL
jgi:hypothetical protein